MHVTSEWCMHGLQRADMNKSLIHSGSCSCICLYDAFLFTSIHAPLTSWWISRWSSTSMERTSVRYLLLQWQRTNVNTSRGTAIVKWNTGHILPANVHLFHEGEFLPKVYIRENWVQKFSVARETVFQCSEQERLVLPCSDPLWLPAVTVFLTSPCSIIPKKVALH